MMWLIKIGLSDIIPFAIMLSFHCFSSLVLHKVYAISFTSMYNEVELYLMCNFMQYQKSLS